MIVLIKKLRISSAFVFVLPETLYALIILLASFTIKNKILSLLIKMLASANFVAKKITDESMI